MDGSAFYESIINFLTQIGEIFTRSLFSFGNSEISLSTILYFFVAFILLFYVASKLKKLLINRVLARAEINSTNVKTYIDGSFPIMRNVKRLTDITLPLEKIQRFGHDTNMRPNSLAKLILIIAENLPKSPNRPFWFTTESLQWYWIPGGHPPLLRLQCRRSPRHGQTNLAFPGPAGIFLHPDINARISLCGTVNAALQGPGSGNLKSRAWNGLPAVQPAPYVAPWPLAFHWLPGWSSSSYIDASSEFCV